VDTLVASSVGSRATKEGSSAKHTNMVVAAAEKILFITSAVAKPIRKPIKKPKTLAALDEEQQ
jgi:hypothetical protein